MSIFTELEASTYLRAQYINKLDYRTYQRAQIIINICKCLIDENNYTEPRKLKTLEITNLLIDLNIIYNGTVDVTVDGTKVAELKDGQFVGEMSFLTEKPATATCVVKHDSEVLVWKQQQFKELLKRNPSLYFTIQSLLSTQVSSALVNISKKS